MIKLIKEDSDMLFEMSNIRGKYVKNLINLIFLFTFLLRMLQKEKTLVTV